MSKVIITLTTVPERLVHNHENGLIAVLRSLCEQNDDDFEIHFNIPFTALATQKEYVIPKWFEDVKLKYPHLKIFRTEDIGPPTKVVPTIERILNPETIILVVDDDLIYHQDMVKEHRRYQSLYEDSAIGYDGIGCIQPKNNKIFDACTYNDYRNHFIACVTKPTTAKTIQHYKSVSYKRKIFKENFFQDYVGKTFSDDVLVSFYLRHENVDIIIVPYESENYLFSDYDNWDKNKGVTSFPVLRHSHGPMRVGTQHPEMLKIQGRFFVPKEFEKK